MSDKIDIVPPHEFMNFTEIVNDLLAKLHKHDRDYILSVTKYELLNEAQSWREHIRRFYSLHEQSNPITFKADPPDLPEAVAMKLIQAVWDSLHYSHYPTIYA